MAQASDDTDSTHHFLRCRSKLHKKFQTLYQAFNVCVSTRTPTPMVEDTATLRRKTPLLVAGLALFILLF